MVGRAAKRLITIYVDILGEALDPTWSLTVYDYVDDCGGSLQS